MEGRGAELEARHEGLEEWVVEVGGGGGGVEAEAGAAAAAVHIYLIGAETFGEGFWGGVWGFSLFRCDFL